MIERALVVGLGSIGLRHLRLLREALPNVNILVLRHSNCSDDILYGAQCTTSLNEACAFKPQVAIIASPAPFHINVAEVLAEEGVHLLIEKPLSDSQIRIEPFLEKCIKNNVIIQVAYNLRFLETLQAFRHEIQSGRIGKILSVRCEIGQYLPGWRPEKDYRVAVSAQKKLGGGVLLELSHELDMLRWVFGDIEWLSSWNGKISSLEIDVEDTAHLVLGFSKGAVGNLSMDFLRHDTTRCCTAIGELGTLRWDAVAGKLSLFTREKNTWEVLLQKTPDRDATYREQISSFLKAVSNGQLAPEVSTVYDGLAALNLVIAAKHSSDNAGQVTIVTEAVK